MRINRFSTVISLILITVAATAAGMFSAWRAPGLQLYAHDWLMRSRGVLPPPEDIVIVAIDEKSIAKLGQFPWARTETATLIRKVSEAEPKVIVLDVLYSEQTEQQDDEALAEAIKNASNVVVSSQLINDPDSFEAKRSIWLRSLDSIEAAAAGIGHVNVETEQDGAARSLLLRLADDEGMSNWALAVEAIRVADKAKNAEIEETERFVQLGARKIPFKPNQHNLLLKTKDSVSRLSVLEPRRMTIDYIGPAGAFAPQTVSFADVLEGKIPAEKFRGKYVLVGATAAALGSRLATPFVHTENPDGDQNGELMPGVEILANELNTILRNRFYQTVPDWLAIFCAAVCALAVLFLLRIAEGKFEALKQLGVLIGLLVAILTASYLVFIYQLIVPPLVPMLVSFAVASPLALLRRSLAVSGNLDKRIAELVEAQERLFTNGNYSGDQQRKLFFSENAARETLNSRVFPRGAEWKTTALGFLSRNLIARSLFVDSALGAIKDGLLIADTNGEITFANESGARILKTPAKKLIGGNLFDRLTETARKNAEAADFTEKTLKRLLAEQSNVEREIVIGESAPRFFRLRLSVVTGGEQYFGEKLGIVATLSDITEHRELQQTKNDVIALVTHELRTPLTAIQGMSEILVEHDVEAESQRKMLAAINSESKRLAQMISKYLDITRLESGAQKAHFASVNIPEIIERTLLLLEPLAAQKQIKITRGFADLLISIPADPELLAQALTNIAANAIKYSPPETEIAVETYVESESFLIRVTDQGFGIPEDALERIFEKFYRVPRFQTQDVPGTGLGLALTREIIEQHGGRISVASSVGKGSVFTIQLPLARDLNR